MRYLFLTLVLFITSCASTSYRGLDKKPPLLQGDGILLSQIQGLSHPKSYNLYEEARVIFQSTNNDLLYFPEKTYDLAAKGIPKDQLVVNELSLTTKQKIHQVLGVKYLLIAEIGNRHSASLYNHTAVNNNERSTEATVNFKLINLLHDAPSYDFRVNTNIGGLNINDDDGGEHQVNVTNDELAIAKAFKKGLKKLQKQILK